MGTSFKELMTKKSEAELMEFLINFNRYAPDAIKAAVRELKSRGRNFTELELTEIKEKIETRIKVENEEDGLWGDDSWKANVVTDPHAPLLYSKGAVRLFSVLFSAIFGAVLLASNIKDTKKKWVVIGFGVAFLTLTLIIVNIMPPNALWAGLLLNTAGGLGLTTTFWDKYVGKEIKYRAKPIWKPLIISIIITIPFVLEIIYG
jgi:hypothetical protein